VSPDELRSIIDAAVHRDLYFPWWSYIPAFGLSLVGAYFGSYIKRKAEDRAAQENYEKLREQLRKTTLDTEEIKTTLLRKNWLTQQQWELRERHYAALLTQLTKLRLSLKDRASYFIEPGSEHDPKRSEGEHFRKLSEIGSESYQTLCELIGPASIFLSNTAIGSLENLMREHWHVTEFSVCDAEYVEQSLRLVDVAYKAVLSEAKAELVILRSDP
jgi:hypothetical protein